MTPAFIPPTATTIKWEPNRKQEQFLALPDSIMEGFYGGAAGGGKSEILLNLPVIRGFHQYPRFKGLILRRTYPELEASLILRAQSDGLYQGCGGKYNGTKHRWNFPSGAVVTFAHLEYEKDVRQFDTAEFNYVAFDELTSFTEFQYIYLAMSRCRSSDSNLPAIVRSASNPGNIGHGWVRDRFVAPCKEGGVIIRDQKSGVKRFFVKALVTDNTALMQSDPEYIRRLDMLPEAERRAKRDGDWYTFSGQVFSDWRIEPMSDEREQFPNAQHVIEPFPIPSYWPKVLAVDWGYQAMMWAGWGAASPDGRCYLYREYACKQTKISTWATEIGRLSMKDENLMDVVMDPSAMKNLGHEKTIDVQFKEYSGLTPHPADNDRIGGKILLQEYLRWKPKPTLKLITGEPDMELAHRIMRFRGMDAYNSYLSAWIPEPPELNLPKLQVFDTCNEVIKAIPLCVYAQKKTDGKNPEDVAEFDGDDPYDGTRYLLKRIHNYFEKSNRAFVAVQARDQITKNFELTGDWNRLHREAEILEKRERILKTPIRRFGRAHRRFGRVA